MSDVRLHDEILGQVVVCFDGRVLEVFTEGSATTSARFHVALLVVEVQPPDRKGRHQIDFAPVRPGRNGVRLILNDADRAALQPVLDELHSVLA